MNDRVVKDVGTRHPVPSLSIDGKIPGRAQQAKGMTLIIMIIHPKVSFERVRRIPTDRNKESNFFLDRCKQFGVTVRKWLCHNMSRTVTLAHGHSHSQSYCFVATLLSTLRNASCTQLPASTTAT